ncbi:MAG: hypothetical protein HY902_18500 [Deltaproteobacteria bacterium]|nr:hypothetical protein [Deltaproteobacteria bacterium]
MAWTFFNIQMAFRSPPGDPLRQAVRDLVVQSGRRHTPNQHRAMYRRLNELVQRAMPQLQRWAWDLVRTDAARDDYQEWNTDLEDTSDVPDLQANAATPFEQHAVITVILLAPRDSPADKGLGELCDIEESQWMRRATCSRLLAGLETLDFASVHGDGIYLQPGPRGHGPLATDLDEGWDWLGEVE